MAGGILASAKEFAELQPDTAAGRIVASLVAHCEGLEGRRQAHHGDMVAAKESERLAFEFMATRGISGEDFMRWRDEREDAK